MVDSERILIRDFDATYQAKLWIESMEQDLQSTHRKEEKNKEAQEIMKAMLRVTLLLSGELNFFYSEVFDGIFLMEWGPKKIARFLGYSSEDDLPITIIGPANTAEEIKEKACQLKNSTKHCKCGLKEDSSLNQWIYGNRSVDSGSLTSEEYDLWYIQQSDKWIQAIEDGKVNLVHWDKAVGEGERTFDLKGRLADALEQLNQSKDNPVDLPSNISRLMNMVLNLPADEIQDKNEAIDFAQAINNGQQTDFYDKSNQKKLFLTEGALVEKRASILYFIDEIEEEAVYKYLVYWWWNKQYMQTIADKYQASYLSFHAEFHLTEVESMQSSDSYNLDALAEKLELKYKEISSKDLAWQKWNALVKSDKKKNLLISGNILDDIMELTPHTFLQLKNNMERPHFDQEEITASKIYDISMMISETIDTAKTYHSRLKTVLLKVFFIGSSSLLLSLFDYEILEKRGLYFYLWGAVLIIVTLPWEEIREILSLRKSNLNASIRVYEDRNKLE